MTEFAPDPEPEPEPIKPLRTFTELHKCKLTDDEVSKYAIELGAEVGRLVAAQRAKEEATKMHGATIKGHEAKCNELSVMVNQRWEYRQVELDELEDWDNKRIIHVRKDTGEITFKRPMTETERQPKLPMTADTTEPAN